MAWEATLAVLAFGPQLAWAYALLHKGRIQKQRALFVFLSFSGITGAALMLAYAADLIASDRHYFLLYLVNEIGSLALLAAALFELIALCLSAYPKFQSATTKLVNGLMVACAFGALSIVFLPQSWISSMRQFHLAERSVIELSLASVWALFWLGRRYFNFKKDQRVMLEGSLLTMLSLGYAAMQIWNPSWGRVAICFWAASCFGLGATIGFRSSKGADKELETVGPTAEQPTEEVREALARLDLLHRSLDVAGKG